MSYKLSREDRLALLNSEVYQELEMAERQKQAQSLSDKIVNSPTAQKAISDGITRALNKDDDGEMGHGLLKEHMSKLDDHDLLEFSKMFADEVAARGLDSEEAEKDFEDEEQDESEEDESEEDAAMGEVLAYVKASLNHLANSAADSGNTEAAYLIERFIQKIS